MIVFLGMGERQTPQPKGDEMSTQYTVYPSRDEYDYLSHAVKLTAKTDIGARRQAKKIAQARRWKTYYISFFRSSDGCRGNIDA
jgi:hypothetical protein